MLCLCFILLLIKQSMSQTILVCEEDLILPHYVQIKEYKVLMIMGKWFMLCRCGIDWRDKMFSFKRRQQEFICYLQRLIDEEYKTSLEQLVGIVEVRSKSEVENCWIAIFKIYSFSCKRIRAYLVDNPMYGQKVKIKSQGKMQNCVVSNCFKKNNSYFYFTNREKTVIGSGMDVILDENCEKILGFSLKIGELDLCLPISEFFSGNSTAFAIEKNIESTISKVVYISHEASYCTGILFSPTCILTVKHLFSSMKPIGTIVDVRFYPYQKEMKAKVCGFIAAFIDLVVLSMNDNDYVSEQEACLIVSKGKQQNTPTIQIGMNVHAIGFGKYSYSSNLFKQINLLLPTVAHGIISKVIDHNQQQVYFKTDILIYNGYSGCPIWHESSWIGNAFFIVKNPISSAKHPRHNFSYCRRFIQHFEQNHGVKGNKSNISTFLRYFEKILTRRQLKIVAKL